MFAGKVRSKYVGVSLLALLVLTLVPVSMSFAEKQEEKRVEKFVEITAKAKDKVDDLLAHMGIEHIEDLGNDELSSAYYEALGNLTSAKSKTLSGQEAVEKAKKAMIAFRWIFSQLHALSGEEGADTEIGERARGISVAIDRAYERIERIKDVNETYLTMYPPNETINGWILANLTAAETNLAKANDSIVLYHNVLWAEGNLTEANQNISEAFAALKSLANWASSWRIESFLMGVKNSVDRTLELLEGAGVDLNHTVFELGYQDDNGNGDFLDDFLEDIEGNLTATRGFRRAGGKEIKQAIRKIKHVRQMLMEVRKASHSKGGGHGKKP